MTQWRQSRQNDVTAGRASISEEGRGRLLWLLNACAGAVTLPRRGSYAGLRLCEPPLDTPATKTNLRSVFLAGLGFSNSPMSGSDVSSL